MKILPKLISLILSIAMLTACFCYAASASDNSYFDEANALLTGLGFEDAQAKAAEYISRDKFVDILVQNSYYDNTDKSTLALSGIYADTNYYFHPDNNITLKDALTLCVRVLGMAQDGDIDDFALLRIASNLKLMRGINAQSSDYITYCQAYILLYNYLIADLSSYSNQYPYIGNSVLNDKYKVYEISGMVDAAGAYTLNGKKMSENRMSIDSVIYKYNSDGEVFFGRYVTAYVAEKGKTDEIIALSVTEKSRVILITPENKAVFSDNLYEYTDENGNTRKAKISVNADIFRNGDSSVLNVPNAVPESGCVTVIDNGAYSDGADIVIVEEAETVKVSGINKEKESWFSSGVSVVPDEDTILTDDNGKNLGFGDVVVGDILSVYMSDNSSVYKVVKLTGNISSKLTGVTEGAIVLGDTTYSLSSSVASVASEYMGKAVTVTLDAFNTAVYIDEVSEKSGIVGVILASKLQKGSFEDKLHIKIFTEEGVTANYMLDKKCKINSIKYDSFAAAEQAIPKLGSEVKVGIVRYTLNSEGLVTELDFSTDKLMDIEGGSKIYKTGEDNLKNLSYITYKKWSEIFGEGVFIEPSTKVFRIPRQEEDGTIWDEEALYSVFTCSSLTSGTNYTATSEGYSLDKNDKVADYVIIRYDGSSGAAGVSDDTRLFMVGSISKTFTPDGDEAEAITIYNKDNSSGRIIYGKTIDYFSSQNIAAGDLIRINYISQTSMVKAVELVYKKGADTLVGGGYLYNGSGGGEGKVSEIRLCKVLKNWNPVVDLIYANISPESATDSDIKPIKASLYGIFRYNEKLKKVETVTTDEIISYELAGNNCSTIVFDDRWYDPFSVFIVK